ncbi:pantoate--beta-alanine ligase [Alteribacter lacisalsi]|uniref:Pantothenate synthetase n=1 Tax=Alteribacter lacisalsi TaxID=2045244 RepID=A0A2W0H972_9BACI|nr:pantoate--beta-alanine ligase [Alteribacter lacisalsi]PYZ98394.1 pantoate--beta-alanine ligase [Alteribacter lacisalsi]
MITARRTEEVRRTRSRIVNQTIGFVPTMGFLHEGHLSLIRRAKQDCGFVVVSIFVNPLQFGAGEDYDTYPRNEKNDLNLAQEAGADLVFLPGPDEMYPKPMSSSIRVEKGTDILCGASRPGHFDGVVAVVTKLFNIVQPDFAYFGQKDAQQAAIIETMVQDYHIPVTIVTSPTVREPDGLAKSSRNVNLTAEERKKAPAVYRSLEAAVDQMLSGEDVKDVLAVCSSRIAAETGGQVDYVELCTWPELKRAGQVKAGEPLLLACAVRFSKVRLIDNIIFTA